MNNFPTHFIQKKTTSSSSRSKNQTTPLKHPTGKMNQSQKKNRNKQKSKCIRENRQLYHDLDHHVIQSCKYYDLNLNLRRLYRGVVDGSLTRSTAVRQVDSWFSNSVPNETLWVKLPFYARLHVFEFIFGLVFD